MKEIVIIGGGPSGIAAALTAAKENKNVKITILEGLDRIGKKILATGNGHCNLGNKNIYPKLYHSSKFGIAKSFISDMPTEKTTDFFESLGLYCMTDDAGRIYPYCRQATMVLDILLLALKRENINVICGFKAVDIAFKKNRFVIKSEDNKTISADSVIIATGGKAAPKQGITGIGYKLAEKFGHHTTPLRPSLVALECAGNVFKNLKGIRANVDITLFLNKKKVSHEIGELQFTDYGISGIPAMQLSGFLSENVSTDNAYVSIDFFPEINYDTLKNDILNRIKLYPKETLENLFAGMLNKKITYSIFKLSGIEPLSRTADTLSKNDIENILNSFKAWKFKITNTLSWDNAQVTGGGIYLDEIDENFQSVYMPNLFITGEILDIAGDCGGYNLHWAWCSGMTAGKTAAENLK